MSNLSKSKTSEIEDKIRQLSKTRFYYTVIAILAIMGTATNPIPFLHYLSFEIVVF